MGRVVQLKTALTEEAAVDRQAQHETAAQRAAEAHLAACQDAMFEAFQIDDPQAWPASPSIGPFCGCDTCVVREILHAAWPELMKAAREEVAREQAG